MCRAVSVLALLLLAVAVSTRPCNAFLLQNPSWQSPQCFRNSYNPASQTDPKERWQNHHHWIRRPSSSSPPSSCSSSQRGRRNIIINNMAQKQFDVSKPVFDVLSLRQIRGDALVRYDSLNQSEPLRIVLSAIATAILLVAPSLQEALGYDPMPLPATAASFGLAVGSIFLFRRECMSRSQQLSRIEKELDSESLPIRLPTNPLADQPFSQRAVTLKETRQRSNTPPRILALCGDRTKLVEALDTLAVLGKQRLKQASVYVVVVATDGSTPRDWKGDDDKDSKWKRTSWLADPYQPQVWLDYFARLSDNHNGDDTTSQLPAFRWFGLNASGRSFGSGDNDIPQWLQILGQYLRPTEFLDPSDASVATNTDDESILLQCQQAFYQALTTGDQESMKSIFDPCLSGQVTEVIDAGGRIDAWKECLADGARPSDMKISGGDATVVSPTEAYTTVVEFPASTVGMDTGTLLAVQKWIRDSDGGDDEWKLALHQTIPWNPETKAQGTLRCDCRGCVALTRSPERRTFGGIIG